MLGVAPRFDGGNWTMAFVAINTSFDAFSVTTRPRHLILVVADTFFGGSVLADFGVIASYIEPELTADDRVTVIISARAPAQQAVLGLGLKPDELSGLPRYISTPGGVSPDPYDAIARAYEIAMYPDFSSFDQHVLFFTDGSRGSHDLDSLAQLGAQFAARDIPISSFGAGVVYDGSVASTLAEASSGNYYFAESAQDLVDAIRTDAGTGFVALAKDLQLAVQAQSGYHVGRIYGARASSVDDQQAVLQSPALFVGTRHGSSPSMSGRRGGGGGWFVELVADVKPSEQPMPKAPVFSLSTSFFDPRLDQTSQFDQMLITPVGVGQNPTTGRAYFSDEARAKPFMMLNMYLALRTTLELYESGNCAAAQGVQDMMKRSYDLWAETYADSDIDADFALLRQLTSAIARHCAEPPVAPKAVEVRYACFLS
jgi:Ca-activated chloride channel family protein